MARGRGSGWHRESRRHHDAALKGRGAQPRRNEIPRTGKGTSIGGMYVTTYPVKTVEVGKKTFDIPSGPGGKVPEEAIIARFLNEHEGDRDGAKRNIVIDSHDWATTRLPADPTVEQIKDWWAYPNESDVKNIDTPDANIFNAVVGMSKGSKEANKTIAVVGGTEEQRQEVRKAIATGFTIPEQRAMRGTTVYITDLSGASGEYHGKSFGGNYLVKLDRRTGVNAETVDHEMIHHLRTVDEKREDPLVKARTNYIGKDRDLEEAATVAETQARHKPYEFHKQFGYYSFLKDPTHQKAEDRGLFTRKEVKRTVQGGIDPSENSELVMSGRKGKRAVKATQEGWPKSNIAHLNIKGKGEAIDQWYLITGKNGKTIEKVQVYSPQAVKANVRPRKSQTVYEYRDGKKVKIAGGDR
jgi:hypothetical protein